MPKLCLCHYPATVAIGAVIFALAGAGLLALDRGDRALASHVGCGDRITTDMRLDSDLVDCPNNGIVIGADGVTLNLNGHTIGGDGAPATQCNPRRKICDVGIVSVGHDGVTVRGGSVREFDIGVFVGKANRNELVAISSSRNLFFGIIVLDSARSLVRDSSGSDNPSPEGDGLGLFGSHDIRIVDNTFRGNGLGMHVEDSSDNLISGNVIARNTQPGILMEADRNQVRRNRCARNGVCIDVATGSGNVVARNRASRGLVGVWIENGRGNLVAHNVVVGARRAGIRLGIGTPSIGGANNVVRRNLVRGGGDDGFLVNQKDDHSLLRRNVAVGAGDDGFDVRSRTAKLTGNRALRNADLGFEAVQGVIDGDGNRASGNGDGRQCVNVVCQ